ncbi:hypothetical protein [Azohydromonas aeria]|uniref:hypothetical protein n=1 Tax=Azohydromonas aeria TaxID=2590212 RepID=UPI0012F856EE|nr:hypothetical protein [Azohydromonas aeria]
MPTVLLFEPQFVLRRTVAAAARHLGMAQVHEAATLQAAVRMASQQRYDLAILAFDGASMAEVEAFARSCNAGRVIGLIPAGSDTVPCTGMSCTLRKPLKVRELLQHLQG